ncbi:MAG: tRNA (N6-isopentenyl adenosine(37)-C2)-methylthiotransferase MiaB [Bacilli bacterium]|nr:tRNA (N6-isopentenyl adenosine(37)-C2)-methylthiotransferase MiaB [Bacilli bacterium]MDD3349182.1 tRNA (N6-isopentenyl adenosine(37)-C2)-methylthiotransferase MiaB [Bacilli bacterium]MDD4056315.1 tRNA (N6-isopentenyl adenosine(37)-C2)-methylthiotransferase MiaB [Bacilli bacterium]MDY0209333.1 tRNA (N6-isopentenyl adenosine(37)-C2)-methylthiotransferase MiaB [Bacilli bacterium]
MKKEYSKYFAPSLKDARKRVNKDIKNIIFDVPESLVGLGNNLKYHIKTYGCQGNLSDSEKIAGILEMLGFTYVNYDEEADLILFNTCAIRENAEDRVFGELGRVKSLKKTKPNLILGICGCMPQEEKVVETIKNKHPQVDIVFGTHNIYKLPEYLADAFLKHERVVEVYSTEGNVVEEMPVKRDHSHKAWVDIMYGCDEFCTYCIVPYTRGRERSRQPEDIIREVETLADDGYIEVTLLGQNVNAYGKDLDREYKFANLLADLNKTKIKRIRFTTSHPKDLDDETIAVMAKGGNIMPHLHLPVQSGSNVILKKMNRKYTKEEYLEKIGKLKKAIPDISLTTDIIVGFPEETEDDFNETLSLVNEVGFEGAYTFIFSPREGTPASKYTDNVKSDVKKERLLTLNQLINEGFAAGNKRFEGEIVDVLVEGTSDKREDIMMGYTPHNKLVNFPGGLESVGRIVKVKIEKAYTWHLKGKMINEE